ncbi:MAG TPA: phosphoribosyltransferase family protein [Ilumatobacter sp.]|nr:phosphoribosyltransferase family protein [Ilumatobacter sp.]
MFADRADAGRRLAGRLTPWRGSQPIVAALPRGGVPVAAEAAAALGAPLDVILVRKLGMPGQHELAIGALGERGVRVIDDHATRVAPAELETVERRERTELERRATAYRAVRPREPIAGRTVIVADDGLATGATAHAACLVARTAGAATVVLAVPVAPRDWVERLGAAADHYVAVDTPQRFSAVGEFYVDFGQVGDDEVVRILSEAAT